MNLAPENQQAQSLNEAVLLALNTLDRAQRERAIERAAETVDPDGLVGLISAEDAMRRNAALEALTLAGRRSVPALVRALRHPDPEVVMFAASTLGKTLDPSAIPHLAEVLKHSDINVCQAAIESLGALRAASTLGALDDLLSGDAWLRFSVVHTLGEIGDPSSVGTLVRLLDDDQLRESAISALGKIGGVDVIGELMRRLEASVSAREFSLCVEALGNALAHIPDLTALRALRFWSAFAARADATVSRRLIEMLRPGPGLNDGGDELGRKVAAIDLVANLRLKACFPEMIAAAADERLFETLLFAAADIGASLVPHLTAAFSHRNRLVRELACRAMAAVSIERGGGALIPLLSDPDESIRVVAVRLLSRLHHIDGLAALVGLLTDASRVVREAAAESLCRMDAQLVTIALLRNPQTLSSQPELVLSIMRANPHPMQRGFVESSLRDSRAPIREAAVASLAAQRGADLLAALEPMIADPSVTVRRGVVAALAHHPTERARQLLLDLLQRDGEMRSDVIRALGRIGDDRVIPQMIAVFGACNPVQQAAALDALAGIQSPSVEPFISRQLGHRDAKVRRHAVRALARVGTTSALRRLGIALRDSDPQVRLAVSKALASCPHPIARSALERLSLDPVATVASAARARLGR